MLTFTNILLTKKYYMKHQIYLVIGLAIATGCADLVSLESDASIEIELRESEGLGGEEGSRASGTSGESLAGETPGGEVFAGETSRIPEVGADLGLSELNITGDQTSDSRDCGELRCDSNAMCVSSFGTPFCECMPRYQGDGVSCELQPCPLNASGASECVCDEGYEGDLYYELSAKEWRGSCAVINACDLIIIGEDTFIETDNLSLGDLIHETCLSDDQSNARYRFSFEAGEVYHYIVASGSNSSCDSSLNENNQQTAVDVWPYSGGVLSERGLFHLPALSYVIDECTYDVLGVREGPMLNSVYLAPAGRICTVGERREVSCGEGACRMDGEVICEEGEWVERCTPLPASTDPDDCDGLDSDCDGLIDEDFVTEETTCGVGVCAALGATACAQGRLSDSCLPAESQGNDDSCDGLDQDCDGQSDEAYITQLVSCGEGICRTDGVILCQEGSMRTECTPQPASGEDTNCDGLDQDCDGRADEDYVGEAVRCGVGACLFDGFTRCVNGIAEDACTPGEPAEDDVSCDGIDQDCDDFIDEDYEPSATVCGVGACLTSGVTTCEEGEELDLCSPATPLGEDDSCDLIDDDCDGRTDEGFENVQMPCSGIGIYNCAITAPLLCLDGQASFDCDSVLSQLNDETCDGLDDDCDGRLDENYISVEMSCGLGECADTSMTRCVDGEVTNRCLVRSPTGDDSDCDGRDDDCDGQVDESFVEQVVSCGQGECTSTGLARCIAGEYLSECSPSLPQSPDESLCDALDNDCDGRIDEDYTSIRNDCGFGVCFAIGSSSCNEGVELANCVPLPSTGGDADCDGIDQDCDNATDESYPPVVDECGTGVCYTTADSSCVEGEVQNNCTPLPEQGDDSLCDGIDQDCDGLLDEAYQPVPTTCTYGSVCVQDGLTACVNGQVRDVCDPPAFFTGSDNSCNSQDNDCDGQLDEGFVGGVYYCGNGVCQGSGFRSCVNGQEGGGDCSPNNNLASPDNNCNGSDEDCDGRTDEGYGTQNITCGQGVCARNGTQSCSAGSLVNNCTPGPQLGDDSDTNGQDDDCDGRIDEDSCAITNAFDGCDGVDSDCDRRVDEDFSSYNGACGQGVCASSGQVTCVNGNEVSSCSPNNNLATTDDNCNSVDNDCDGRFDEHYQGAFEPCGVGACKSNGFFICQGGSPVHDCTPSQPQAEILGNGVDDDCDQSVDEGAPEPTSCGNFEWYISSGNIALDDFCCFTEPCESWHVSLSVMQPGDQASSAQDEIICKDNIPYSGSDRYYITARGPYFYRGNGDFSYWLISDTGHVRDSGRWACRGPEGSGGGSF